MSAKTNPTNPIDDAVEPDVSADALAVAAPRRSNCPICSKPSVAAYVPFCSPRCSDVDLNRWLTGSYAIPGRAVEEDEID